MKTLTTTIGRVLYAIPFLMFGGMHFMKADMMTGMVPPFMPMANLWVYLIGACFMAAGISILINRYTKISGLLLAMLLMIFIITIHIPGIMSGDAVKMQIAMPNMLKDLALAGAALLIAGMKAEKSA